MYIVYVFGILLLYNKHKILKGVSFVQFWHILSRVQSSAAHLPKNVDVYFVKEVIL